MSKSAIQLREVSGKFPPQWLAIAVWGVAAAFYLTGFYQRVSPAVMTSELMRSFGIGAKELGNLSAFYFYAYVAMQIPTGVLVDSWGARKLLILGSLLAAAGTILFGATGNYDLACAGRANRRRRHRALRLAIERFGWRAVVLGSAIVILGVCVLAWTLVKNDPSESGFIGYAPSALHGREKPKIWALLAGFKSIFAYRNTWLIFFAQGGVVGPILAFTGLWGAPFLKARFGLPPTKAAAVCSVMIVC